MKEVPSLSNKPNTFELRVHLERCQISLKKKDLPFIATTIPKTLEELTGPFIYSIAQWSEGVTKPIKKYSQVDTVWDFLITFECKMKE